ncbi:MAG: TetR-like C-terminal domain-containing protein [Acetobacteraceae bacterium]
MALRGFERLAEALAAAWNEGRPDALRGFEALGRAYLAFARREPAHYAAMFETRIPFEAYPGLLAASDRAFAILRDAADRLTATLPRAGRPPGSDDRAACVGDVATASPRCSSAPIRRGANCRCRRRTCWRRAC